MNNVVELSDPNSGVSMPVVPHRFRVRLWNMDNVCLYLLTRNVVRAIVRSHEIELHTILCMQCPDMPEQLEAMKKFRINVEFLSGKNPELVDEPVVLKSIERMVEITNIETTLDYTATNNSTPVVYTLKTINT